MEVKIHSVVVPTMVVFVVLFFNVRIVVADGDSTLLRGGGINLVVPESGYFDFSYHRVSIGGSSSAVRSFPGVCPRRLLLGRSMGTIRGASSIYSGK